MIDPNGIFVQGFILGTGVIGQLLVAHMNYRGFYYWLAGNAAMVMVSIYFGSYGMVALYTFYSVMAVYSIQKWKKRQVAQSPI